MGGTVSVRVDWTPAFEHLDKFEDGVDCGLLVQRHCKLTSASTMTCRAFETELLWFSNSHGVHLCDVVHARSLLARVVRLRSSRERIRVEQGRVVESADTKRYRRFHDQVGITKRGECEGQSGQSPVVELHLRSCGSRSDCVRSSSQGVDGSSRFLDQLEMYVLVKECMFLRLAQERRRR